MSLETRARAIAMMHYWTMPKQEREERLRVVGAMAIAGRPELENLLEVAIAMIQEQLELLDAGEGTGHG
jgi:hypothetical protein